MLIYGLIALLILLNIGDIASTMYVLKHGGNERNPVARWFMDRLGVLPGAIALKGISTALGILLVFTFPAYWWMLIVLCAIAFIAILVNLDTLDAIR